MTESDPAETPPRPQLSTMLPALLGAYVLMVGAGWLWLSLRGRTGIVASAAVGSHGPALAAGVGLAAALGLFGLGCLLTRYVATLAELARSLRHGTSAAPLRMSRGANSLFLCWRGRQASPAPAATRGLPLSAA